MFFRSAKLYQLACLYQVIISLPPLASKQVLQFYFGVTGANSLTGSKPAVLLVELFFSAQLAIGMGLFAVSLKSKETSMIFGAIAVFTANFVLFMWSYEVQTVMFTGMIIALIQFGFAILFALELTGICGDRLKTTKDSPTQSEEEETLLKKDNP